MCLSRKKNWCIGIYFLIQTNWFCVKAGESSSLCPKDEAEENLGLKKTKLEFREGEGIGVWRFGGWFLCLFFLTWLLWKQGKLLRVVAMASKRVWKHVLVTTCIFKCLERFSQHFISFAWMLLDYIMLMQENVWKAAVLPSSQPVCSLSLEAFLFHCTTVWGMRRALAK